MNNLLSINSPFIFGHSSSLKWKIGLRVFWILAVLSAIALLAFYIFQTNAEVSERYLIQGYNKTLSEFSKENQDLGINSIQMNSLGNISALLEKPLEECPDFEKVDKIYYIQVLDSQIVTK